ncbi:hypothetical protein [Sulfurospirillum barnesii]|uniref:NlpC/P60 domain-containing protein n=1 Tax=Sulfurospirillum barnesii (strain ATCC 700032 / DSM 10660 / SES-3) TaxID=760154 RepID=I3XXX2_SULBS|nr:hypothetical protein [Sulfurospirillum barnesii]AFL68796.1 hypothetical protein Sulba_1508 [Sulfurospirillum barnesii SES-3]
MKRIYLLLLITLFLLSGCTQKIAVEAPPPAYDDTPKRDAIVFEALKYRGKKDGGDCSGFVSLVNQKSLEPYFQTESLNAYFEDSRRSLAIYNLLDAQNRLYHENPKIGDLIFFANTVKKYAKQKSVDNITHIGIITKVESDETIHFIHHTKGRNLMGQMNLAHPNTATLNNKPINTYLEKCSIAQSHQCLAPAYFSAYGKIQ